MITGSWNIYAKRANRYSSLDFSVPGGMESSSRRVFRDNGSECPGNLHGATYVLPIESSIGKAILIKMASGEERLSPDSQLPPYRRKYAAVEEYQWPVMDQAYRQPKFRQKLLVLGSHRAWITSGMNGKEQTNALWKTYPMELLRTLFFEVFKRRTTPAPLKCAD